MKQNKNILKQNNMNLKLLKKTIPFKWRVQSSSAKGAMMVAYIDARDVMDTLDTVCGQDGWQSKFEQIGNALHCSIGIKIDDEWVWKSDRGTPTKTEAIKGEASDAFKRAAVMWGINREAYQLGTVRLKTRDYEGKYYPCDENGNFLKGEKLYNVCNKLAKIEELEFFEYQDDDKNKGLEE